jgi:hypothetical protein
VYQLDYQREKSYQNCAVIMNIGNYLHEYVKKNKVNITWLAGQINTSRRNMMGIFDREDVNTSRLVQISKILKHDFLNDVRKESSLTGVAEDTADYRKENELLREQLQLTEQLLESKQKELNRYIIKRNPHGQNT